MNGFERLLILADFKPNTNKFFWEEPKKKESTFSLTHIASAGFLLARLQVTTRIRQAQDASKMKKKKKEATYQYTKPRSEKKIKKKEKDSL